MSGGVDSSVAAWLLKQQGYQVAGVTMLAWHEEREGGCGLGEAEDARRVAGQLGIPYYVVDFRKEFKSHVMDWNSWKTAASL